MTISKILCIFFGLAFLSINAVYGATLNVPADHLTIQAAVDAANDGDTILVGPGTYHENVEIINNNLILKGDGINSSIIEWDGPGPSIFNSILFEDGFFILIEGFTINSLNDNGIYLAGDLNFTNGEFYGTNAVIRNCEIIGHSYGINIFSNSGESYIENNIINDGILVGGGTYYIQNNTIVDGLYNGIRASFQGLGSYGMLDGRIIVRNNIIASNKRFGIAKEIGYQSLIQFNNVWNNAQGNYTTFLVAEHLPFTPFPGTGEISENPDFVGGGDYHLKGTSPCIDTGLCMGAINSDIDGDDRPVGYGCDMGADEFIGPIWTKIDLYLIPKWRPRINSLISSRRLPISILTTDVFDANNVDPLSIELEGAYAIRWKMKDVDKDGDKDMKIFFKTRDLDLNEDVTEITLEGETYDGIQFFGTLPVTVDSKGNACAYGNELPRCKQRGINKGYNQFYRRERRGIRPSALQ